MKIGKLSLNGNLVLAPMSSVTNLPLRLLARKYGAALVYSEMISSEAVSRQSERSLGRGFTCAEGRPVGIQLFGSNPDLLVRSAHVIAEKCMPELIDINLGCPARGIIENECGAALLNKPDVVAEIVERLSSSLDTPLTAKIRVLKSLEKTLVIARTIEKAGADALIVHGRTQKQKYSGKSNIEFIKAIKKELTIPVIANGDISDEKTAEHVLEYTQSDGLMIGRAAIGNPYIFRRISHYLDTGELLPLRTIEGALGDFFEYEALCRRYGVLTFRDIMAKAIWFTKGMTNIKAVRVEINKAKDIGEILGIMERLRESAH